MKNVEVVLIVEEFVDISSPGASYGFSKAKMVAIGSDAIKRINGRDYLRIKEPSVLGFYVREQFLPVPVGEPLYVPIGIAFRESPQSGRTVGRPKSFGKFAIEGDCISVHDAFIIDKGDLITYEFYIMIQRSDGAIGVIDPGVEHDEQN